jgi:hypothetical protein
VKERGHTGQEATIAIDHRRDPDHRATTTGDQVIGLDLATDGMTGRDLAAAMKPQRRPTIDNNHLLHLCTNQRGFMNIYIKLRTIAPPRICL